MRYVFGPSFDSTIPAPSAKADPTPEFLGVEGNEARYRVLPYSLEDSHRLAEIRVFLLPSGSPNFASAADLVASGLPSSSADVGSFQEGITVAIPLPTVDPGSYLGQTVYGYED